MSQCKAISAKLWNSPLYGPGLNWWLKTYNSRSRLPLRRELNPEVLSVAALPHVLMVDIIGNVEDLRFRLVGTAHVEFNRRDLTGLLFSQVYPKESLILSYIKGLYREMIVTRRPVWSLNEFVPPTRDIGIVMSRLMLPLSSDGVHVDICVAIQKITYEATADAYIDHPWHTADYHGEKERFVLRADPESC